MSAEEGKVVSVTGASGYVASRLVKLLLERGYTVKASVRDLNDPEKTDHLVSLVGAKERLHLFQANLLEEGSFDPIVDGCQGVFHTASPFLFSSSDPEADVVEPAVRGTLNVLQACAKVASIKRVVLTSSMTAVQFDRRLKDGMVVDESWFSDPSFCKELKLWYPLSKTLAESAAWKFTKEHGIDMVVINPGMVFGPVLQPRTSLSLKWILSLVNGGESFPHTLLRWVDVRDVATAHILAFEIPHASGRYCLVESVGHRSEIINTLQRLYPTLQIADNQCLKGNVINNPEYKVSNEKVKSLGMEFISLEVTLKDTIESFREMKLIGL